MIPTKEEREVGGGRLRQLLHERASCLPVVAAGRERFGEIAFRIEPLGDVLDGHQHTGDAFALP